MRDEPLSCEKPFLCTKLIELDKIRVGAVSYLNTKPLLFGIKRADWIHEIELVEEYPSRIAAMLAGNRIDVGLVPVAVIPKLGESYIISDFCIGAEGEVASVALFSEVPLENVETVLLDYQSNTSVNLARILLRDHWKKDVMFRNAAEDFRSSISGTTAGVVIGDRALEQRKISAYTYDLGAAWKAHTGLPFVFAAWVANKELPAEFIARFNAANALGIAHIPDVVKENPYATYDLTRYYTANISYPLTDEKRKGLRLFLHLLGTLSSDI